MPYAQAQPLTGQFWCRVDEEERGQVPVVKVSYKPTLCNHCADAPCIKVCVADAFMRRDDGFLLLNPAKCTGCGACIDACPIKAIYFNASLNIAQKCTGCAHLMDDDWAVPRCVDACNTDAMLFAEESELDLTEAVCLHVMQGLGTKVYYKNLPKRFAAGCVYDPITREVVIDAEVSLCSMDGAEISKVRSDEFGDWKFDPIEPAVYKIKITAKGYDSEEFEVDTISADKFTGDLALSTC
jgi:Fe-S-cluster-containing dehydrogenase component